MTRQGQFNRCFTLLLVLASLLGLANATATVPLPQPPKCGSYLSATDIDGSNLPGSGKHTKNDKYCVKLCKKTAGCTASVRNNGTGHCYLKRADIDTIVPTAHPHFTSHILCEKDIKEVKPVKPVKVECGKWLQGKDLPGRNLPGSGKHTKNLKYCWKLCQNTKSCNSVVRSRGGHCYMKNVDLNNVHTTDSHGFATKYKCPPKAPKAPKAKCGKAIAGVDIAGLNLPGSGTNTKDLHWCKKLCKNSKDGCNAVAMSENGDCYLKKVDVKKAELNPRDRFTSFMFCPPKESPKKCKGKDLGEACECPKGVKWCNSKKHNPCCKGMCLPVLNDTVPTRKLAGISPPAMECRMPGPVIRPRAEVDDK